MIRLPAPYIRSNPKDDSTIWDEIKAEAISWAKKFVQLKEDLYKSGQQINWMNDIIALYPDIPGVTEREARVDALTADQKEYELKFFDFEEQFLSLLSQLGITIPGLGTLSTIWIPIAVALALMATAGALYWEVTNHVSSVNGEASYLSQLTGKVIGSGGGFWSTLAMWIGGGIAAAILLPSLLFRRS